MRLLNRLPHPLRSALAGLALLSGAHASAESPAAPIPVDAFFAEPDYLQLQLSPDGHYVAFLTTLGTGKVGIALLDLATGKTDALVAAKDENIKGYLWKGSDRIVFWGDVGGNESYALRAISISRREVVALAESVRDNPMGGINPAGIVDTLHFDPDHVLISGTKEAGNWSTGIYRLDVRTGDRSPVDTGGDAVDIEDYAVDNAGKIRARARYEGDQIVFEVRPTPTSDYVKFASSPARDPQWEFHGFAADNETLYVVSRAEHDTGALHRLNVRTRELGPVLFNTPDGEISRVLQSWDRKTLYGVAYETEKPHTQFFDAGRALVQASIDASLPGTANFVVSTSQDEQLLVVAATSDREPGAYYLLDRRHGRLSAIGRVNRLIDPSHMRPMEPITFTARDGLTIHGYLTRPAGAEGRRVPLVVNPHGGPFGIRDEWSFNPEVQFLASRGYAVLQINYRGSGGYGGRFEHAGYKEWGGRMQDDLTDGVKWAIAQGIADPGRVGIYGASYGGYAALAGVTFTPELYRCGVNYVGVSDLSIIAGKGNEGRVFSRGYELHAAERVGDDPKYLHDHSPLNFVERIRVPTLHAYGYNDPRVDFRHWERLEPKLKQYGKTYEILIEGNEGHGFRNEANRFAFYQRLEAFLAKYLAPAAP